MGRFELVPEAVILDRETIVVHKENNPYGKNLEKIL